MHMCFLILRECEVRSLLEMRGITDPRMCWAREIIEGDETPFMEVELPSVQDAMFLGSRSISIKGACALCVCLCVGV